MFKRATWFWAIGSTAWLPLAAIGCRADRLPPPAPLPPVTSPATQPATQPTTQSATQPTTHPDLPPTEPSHDAPPRQPVY